MPLPVINAAAPLNTNDDANGPSAADASRNANTNHVGRSNSLDSRNGGAPHDDHQGAHLHFNWNDMNSFAPFNNANDDMAMMMRRHSLMSNAGSVMMHPHHHHRGSLGFGDGYNNGYTFNSNGHPQQNFNETHHHHQEANGNDDNNANLEDVELDEDDPEATIDYLAARAHAAQMLAQEEAKRLQDKLQELAAKRGNNNNNSKKAAKKAKSSTRANGGGVGGGGLGGQGGNGNPVMMQGMNNMQQLHGMQHQQQAGNNDTVMNMPNPNTANNMMNTNNYNIANNSQGLPGINNNTMTNKSNITDNSNTNLQNNSNNHAAAKLTDEQLFEQSRKNSFQMNMMEQNFQGWGNVNMPMNNYNQFQMNTMFNEYSRRMSMGMGMGVSMGGPTANMMMGNPMMGNGNNTNNMNGSANINNNAGTTQAKNKKKRKRQSTSNPSELPAPQLNQKLVTTVRRPLSAYNIFFSEMREIIIKEEEDAAANNADGKDGNEEDAKSDDKIDNNEVKAAGMEQDDSNTESKDMDAKTASKADIDQATEHDTSAVMSNPQRDMQDFTKSLMAKRLTPTATRRVHRKTHGKISFTTLVKTVGRRWKALPEESKTRYKELAELDRERYKKEKRMVQQAEKEEKKRLKKLAKKKSVKKNSGNDAGRVEGDSVDGPK
eukprot:scaffold4007_cov49-Cyclotella_meneghiniana.AAC.4